MKSRDSVVEAELESASEEISRDERQRGGVCPDYRDIRQDQKPRREKAVVIAEGALRVAECAARVGIGVQHI